MRGWVICCVWVASASACTKSAAAIGGPGDGAVVESGDGAATMPARDAGSSELAVGTRDGSPADSQGRAHASPGLDAGETGPDVSRDAGLAGEPDTHCVFIYRQPDMAEIECRVELTAAGPCNDAVACLCESGHFLGFEHKDAESCVGAWLTPRGAITFSDVCLVDDSVERSLGEALRTFAGFYGAEVQATEACERLPAFWDQGL